MRRLRVLLDANVLVDAQVRDLFCNLAEAELLDVRWSQTILDEASRALVQSLGIAPARAARLASVLGAAFPLASVHGYEGLVERLALPDPDDRHVLAAAIAGECDWLVTENLRDFPLAAVESADLLVLSIDDALVLSARLFPDRIADIVDAQIAGLRHPPTDRESFAKRLGERAPHAAIEIGASLGLDTYLDLLDQAVDAGSDSSPQAAVTALIHAIDERDVMRVAGLIDSPLAESLTAMSDPTPNDVFDVLASILQEIDLSGNWGFGTARRLRGPDTEVVKLIRSSGGAKLIHEPQLVEAHLFELRYAHDHWIIVGVNDPAIR